MSLICKNCYRESFCDNPCDAYLDEFDKIPSKSQNPKPSNPLKSMVSEGQNSNKSESSRGLDISCSGNCIEGFLEFTVDDSEWLNVINGRLSIEKMIDTTSLFSYMVEVNKTYCESNNLCEDCHSELVEVYENRGEHFGRPCGEKNWVCPVCG